MATTENLPATLTFATRANMRRAQEKRAETGDFNHRIFCLSATTGEQYSADPGDYWFLMDDQTVTDSNGEPMVLAIREVRYLDALTGEQL